MLQVFRGKEKIGVLTKTGNTTVQLSSSNVVFGAKQYQTGNLVLDTSISGVGGLTGAKQSNTFYYVYLVLDNDLPYIIGSVSNIKPLGYTKYKKVGAFFVDDNLTIHSAFFYGQSFDISSLSTSPDTSWSNTISSGFYSIKNGKMSLEVSLTFSGSPAGGSLIVQPPAGIVVDDSKEVGIKPCGISRPLDSGTAAHSGQITRSGTGFQVSYIDNDSGTRIRTFATSPTTPFTYTTSDSIGFKVDDIPILGWLDKADWTDY